MKIVLEPDVAIKLEAIAVQTDKHEFSGFGWARREKDALIVYDIVLLHVGSHGYTEIPAEKVREFAEREDAANMRVWFHRHPLGNRTPGPHNWSSTDNATIQEAPLGGIPQIVKWSASIVRTPEGWVGRIDNHITGKTAHVPVEGQAPLELVREVQRLLEAYCKEAQRQHAVEATFPEGDEIEIDNIDLEDLAEELGLSPDDLYVGPDGVVTIVADPLATPIGRLTEEQWLKFQEEEINIEPFPQFTFPGFKEFFKKKE